MNVTTLNPEVPYGKDFETYLTYVLTATSATTSHLIITGEMKFFKNPIIKGMILRGAKVWLHPCACVAYHQCVQSGMEAHFTLFLDVLQRFTRIAVAMEKKHNTPLPTPLPGTLHPFSGSTLEAEAHAPDVAQSAVQPHHAAFGPLHAVILLQFIIIVLLLLKIINGNSPEL